jgi:predicted phosphoribosyltransferase
MVPISRGRRFADRVEAGERMAAALLGRVHPPAIVLGIPRGGVVVGGVVARRLHVPFDVVVPRKVGAPGNPELAVGAVAEGVEAIDHEAVRRLGLDLDEVGAEARRQMREVARRTVAYRAGRQPLDLAGRVTILVDDGIATGWTAVAAARWSRRAGARQVIVAVPVGPPDLERRLGSEVDVVVVLERPEPYMAVGQAYVRFEQVSDEQVLACLRATDVSEGQERAQG